MSTEVEDQRETLEIQWEDIAVTISIAQNWLNSGFHHVEVKAQQSLPITNTGYRSHFMAPAELNQWETVEAFVREWLDDAAKTKRQGFVAVAASDKSVKPLLFEPIDHAALWRGLDPQLVVAAKLTISAVHLADLVQWKIDHAETPVLGRRKPFPGTLRFEVADQHAELVFPADPKARRTLGVVASILNPLDLTQRYLDFATIAKLVQFARDYAVTYEAEVLQGPQGASAIRFNFIGLQYPASITLPLLLSLQGDPMEITSPFANQSGTQTNAQAIESAIESTETQTTNGAPKDV